MDREQPARLLEIEHGPDGLRIVGEVDLSNVALFADAVRARVRSGGEVFLDLSRCTLLGSEALAHLLEAAESLGEDGRLILHAPGHTLRRVLELVGLPDRPNVTLVQPADRLAKSFPSEPTSLRYIRQFVRDQARRHDLARGAAEELTLAVSEAASNAIRHSKSQAIRVGCRAADGCMVVEVADEGVFLSRVPVEELDGLSGRGILLMTAFVDQVAIREGTEESPGTTVTLTKCR